jgi:hypothetical protein
MTFKIKSQDGASEQEVSFVFDINKDTPEGVAEEMVNCL